MSEWQPIETAPKETPVLLFVPKHEANRWYMEDCHIVVGLCWADEGDFGGWRSDLWTSYDDGGAVVPIVPTHWMPLPEPPQL